MTRRLASMASRYRGAVFVVPAAFLLSLGAGGPEETVRWLAPVVACALPVAVLVGDWWRGWPGVRGRHPGLLNVVVAAAGGVGLGLLSAWLLPGRHEVPAIAFVVFVQIAVVSARWPFHRLPPRLGGPCALMSSWSIAALIATLGPWAATELLAVTVTVGAVQIVWMAVLNGGAAARIASMALRVVVMNAVTLGAGTAVYWFGRWAVGDASLWTTLMAGVTASAITASWLQAPAATATAAADAVRTRLAESALFALGAVLLIIGAFVASAPADRESVMAWLAYVGSGALGVSVVSYALLSRWWWPPATGVADAATVAAFQSAPAEPTSGAVVVRNR